MEGDIEREVLSTWREWVYEREMEEEIERSTINMEGVGV